MLTPSLSLLSLGALAISVSGTPLPELPGLVAKEIGELHCFNASLPNVTIYATGGTIAGSAGSADQTTGYQAGSLGIEALIKAVPQLCNVSNVRGIQIANVDSGAINSTILTNLTQQIQKDLDSPYTQGVVVTHGTDTLEESSFFLDLTVKSDKPIVMVGSMRPATAISADGPINLLSAVKLAGSEKAKKCGTMIVLNDRIASARYTFKTNANALDTFKAEEQGFLGVFENIQPVFWYPPARPLGHHYFNISESDAVKGLPQVDILYGHQEVDGDLFKAAVNGGAKGIVLASLGAGGWPEKALETIGKVINETSIPVVISRRSSWGFISGERAVGIGGGYLHPSKARIQLQLAIEKGLKQKEMKEIFEWAGIN